MKAGIAQCAPSKSFAKPKRRPSKCRQPHAVPPISKAPLGQHMQLLKFLGIPGLASRRCPIGYKFEPLLNRNSNLSLVMAGWSCNILQPKMNHTNVCYVRISRCSVLLPDDASSRSQGRPYNNGRSPRTLQRTNVHETRALLDDCCTRVPVMTGLGNMT